MTRSDGQVPLCLQVGPWVCAPEVTPPAEEVEHKPLSTTLTGQHVDRRRYWPRV